MKQFNILFSLLFLTGFTCPDLLPASKTKDSKAEEKISEEKISIELLRKLNTPDEDGNTPLHLAVLDGDYEKVTKLVDCGVMLDPWNKNRKTPEDLAFDNKHEKIKDFLKINKKLLTFTEYGDTKNAQLCLAKGAYINVRDLCGRTPLHIAISNDRVSLITALYLLNADVNIQDNDGNTPFHNAVLRGNECIVLLFIDKAKVKIKNQSGKKPLHDAVKNEVITKLLLEFDTEINVQDNNGNTPLHNAVLWDKPAVVTLLLDKGADKTIKNRQKKTPLNNAQWLKLKDIIALLQS